MLLVPVHNVSSLNFVLSEEKAENIRTNCSDIKDTLKRVQNSDRNTRVSLGRSYQQIISDFITPMNVRLVKVNRFDHNLNEIQNRFASTREQFNQDYIHYSQTLETLLATDCKDNPTDFYNKLIETREAREKVAKTVHDLEAIINEHTEAIKGMKESFRPKENINE